MVASTPIDGAHYAIDIIGGIVVAIIAISLTNRATRWVKQIQTRCRNTMACRFPADSRYQRN